MRQRVAGNKFIGAFVNEMYAILIGIGLGNVLFVQQIDLGNIFEIAMGLFVTGVILLYWWDWTEFLNDHVVSTKTEFVIDFLILINLEILFVYYNSPYNLAIVFIILAILDLAWVINYIYQTSGDFVAKNRIWLFEKFTSIIIFAGVYLLIRFWLIDENLYFQGGLVVASFVAVRKLSFRQVKKAQRYSFLTAEEEDYPKIAAINNSYLDPKKNKAFMITGLSEEKIRDRLDDSYMYYVLKQDETADVLGFIELSLSAGNDILQQVEWFDQEKKDRILAAKEKVLYIEKIAVNKEFKRHGMGAALYQHLFNELPDHSFYAFVMQKPHRNSVSLSFHQKLGFDVAGIFRANEFTGFKNYESVVLLKTSPF